MIHFKIENLRPFLILDSFSATKRPVHQKMPQVISNYLGHFLINWTKIHLMKVRRDMGYEGEVFYFLDCKDNVIGLLKKKTAWYVVLR